jgi:hypothetical protein
MAERLYYSRLRGPRIGDGVDPSGRAMVGPMTFRELSRRSAVWLAIAACGAAVTTCGAPNHTFYDDTKSGTGIGGAAGSAGTSSTGSAGSSAGGSGNTSDGGTSTGGSKGADASAGATGTGGTTGSGGSAGTTSSGGAAGSGGASGGTAGSGGKSDAGMTGGAAGSAGGKVDAGSENCFDNIDNDADGQIDCADPKCASVATCVTEEASHALGVLVDATAACPAGTTATAINRGIVGPPCNGCTCAPYPISCSADVFTYDTAAQCTGDTGLSGGTLVGNLTGPCVNDAFFQGNKAGVRVALKTNQQCSFGGTASVAPARWTTSKKLCAYTAKGGGCAAGKRCVPVQTDATTQCSLALGSTATCGGFGTTQNDWYTGFTDARTCGTCGCTASGGACQNAQVMFGSDYLCTVTSPQYVAANTKSCVMTAYSPPAGFSFAPVNPTCTASAPVSGALTPTGAQTLCCSPR